MGWWVYIKLKMCVAGAHVWDSYRMRWRGDKLTTREGGRGAGYMLLPPTVKVIYCFSGTDGDLEREKGRLKGGKGQDGERGSKRRTDRCRHKVGWRKFLHSWSSWLNNLKKMFFLHRFVNLTLALVLFPQQYYDFKEYKVQLVKFTSLPVFPWTLKVHINNKCVRFLLYIYIYSVINNRTPSP